MVIAYGLTSSLAGGSMGRGWRLPLKGLPIIAAYMALATIFPGRRRIKPYSIQVLMRRKPLWFRQDLATLFQLLAEGKITPVIAKRFPLVEAAAAHCLLASGGVAGKLVLVCGDESG